MNTNVLTHSESAKLWLDSGILFCELNHSDCYLTEHLIITYLSKIEEITKGKPMPFVIDIRKFVGNFSTAAAKTFSNSATSQNGSIVQVFVADTLNGKLLISSYRRLFSHDAHIRIFGDMESAIAYCAESQKKYYNDKG